MKMKKTGLEALEALVAKAGDTVKGKEMCVLLFWFKGMNFNRRKKKLIRQEKEELC